MKVIYHNDPDGYLSAFLIRKHYENNIGMQISCEDFIPMNYGWEFDLLRIAESEVVYIVDFCFDVETMEAIRNRASRVIWIDHHKTAIEKMESVASHYEGIREIGTAACLLTKMFLNLPYIDHLLSEMVIYVSDHDVWKHEFPESKPLRVALDMEAWDIFGGIWDKVWNKSVSLYTLIENGKLLLKYQDGVNKKLGSRAVYEVLFEGHRCSVINTPQLGSPQFESLNLDTYVWICWFYDGKKYRYGIYSKPHSHIDVSEIAKRFGGGGHFGAAGFETTKPIRLFTANKCPYYTSNPNSLMSKEGIINCTRPENSSGECKVHYCCMPNYYFDMGALDETVPE